MTDVPHTELPQPDTEHPSRAKFRRELTSGSLALMLLALLDAIGEPTYGYDIARRIAELAPDDDAPRQGTLYPALRSLEKLGLLQSSVQPSTSGPPRKYYELTDDGRAVLPLWREDWARMTAFVGAVLALHPETTAQETDR